jgi:cohesin complex subunit SCC1
MTLLEARLHGRLADNIFFPPSIHPDLRAMFNPEYLRRFGREGNKRKRTDEVTNNTPKKARIANIDNNPALLEETGFGDGGFGADFPDNSFNLDHPEPSPLPEDQPRHRTVSPSLVDDEAENEDDDEAPTSVTGSMSHSTVAAAQLLQKELASDRSATLDHLTIKAAQGGVKREDAVKMFFEVLVLASRDVVRVQQSKGFGEIRVEGKQGLFKAGSFGQQVLV